MQIAIMMTFGKTGCLLLLVALAIGTHAADDVKSDLVAVFAVIRHGDRAPTSFYPNDPYQNVSYWLPNGVGELNAAGIERMEKAGTLYRHEYNDLLDKSSGWPTYAKSSIRNRSIESAKHFLEKFLPSTPELNVSAMIQLDQLMLTTTYKCDRASAAWLKLFQSEEVTGYLKSKHDTIKYFESMTGANYLSQAPYTLRELEFLTTTLEIERDEYQLTNVPDWAKNATNKQLLADFKKHAYLFDWKLPVMQKYRVGPLLGDIRNNAEQIIAAKTKQRFYLYSTHDVNQVLLLQALGLYSQINEWPTSYSSAIVLELYNQTGVYYIRSLYREVVKSESATTGYQLKDTPLNIAACNETQVATVATKPETLCSLESFKSFIADKVPLNYDEECKMSSSAVTNFTGIWSSLLVVFTIFIYYKF